MYDRLRDLVLFDLAIDSKLRACELVKVKVRDVSHGERVAARAIVMQQKTHNPVQFEITEPTRAAVAAWIRRAGSDLKTSCFLAGCALRCTSRHDSTHGSWTLGCRISALTLPFTARIA